MVPYSVSGQSLGLSLVEHLLVSFIFIWEINLGVLQLFRMDGDAANKILVSVDRSRYIF